MKILVIDDELVFDFEGSFFGFGELV